MSQTLATGNFSGSPVSIILKGHCVVLSIFVLLKPKWEPFRLSNKLLKLYDTGWNRLSATKCDVERLLLAVRTAAQAGRERAGAQRQRKGNATVQEELDLPQQGAVEIFLSRRETLLHTTKHGRSHTRRQNGAAGLPSNASSVTSTPWWSGIWETNVFEHSAFYISFL